MAILSRSSVRQEGSTKPSPTKKPRFRHHPASVTRRKSSPDLLDTTIESDSDKARQVPKSPIPPPTSSIRRPPPASSPATPRHRILEPNYETPSASAALYLQGDRESPDPLDTITPVTAVKRRDLEPVSKLSPSVSRSTHGSPSRSSATVDNNDVTKRKTRTTRKSSSQPSQDTPPAVGRRSLRSQDVGSRTKCELANYFHNYEELLSLAAVKPEFLSSNTTVNLIDDLTEPLVLPSNSSATTNESPFANPTENLHGCEVIELPEPEPCDAADDPLNEGTYFRAHRRIERREKQLRNIERERAQHEKLQVDRLLEELKSHDWIRVLGLTNISDAEKKLYEPKRDFFIKELSLMIEKFNIWRDEEKRGKFGKEKPFARAGTTPPGAAKALGAGSKQRSKRKRSHDEMSAGDRQLNGAPVSDSGDPPDVNDVDAWAARQLHQEANSASSEKQLNPPTDTNHKPTKTAPTLPPPTEPLTSSDPDPSHGSTALAGESTKSFAFGHPIPAMDERDFELPPDILTEEAIQASRRKLRRLRRERRE